MWRYAFLQNIGFQTNFVDRMSICTVTGATGFIGSQLVRKLLANGETVRCLVRASSNTERLNGLDVELKLTDFSDGESLKQGIQGSDIVYHCAGCIMSLRKAEMYQTNCENTKRLAQVCMNSDSAPKLMYISSLAAEKGTRLTDCTQPGNPENSYQSGIYYVARDENPEYGELGKLIGEKLGRKWTIAWHFSRPVFWIVFTASEIFNQLRGRPSIINLDKAAEAISGSWICSNKKAKRELGLKVKGDLPSLIEDIVAGYRAKGWLK